MMAGIDDGAFEDGDGGVAERALRFRPRGAAQRVRKRGGVRHQPHAAAAAAGDRLDHHGKADLLCCRQHRGVALVGALIAGDAGHAGLLHDFLAPALLPIALMASARADEDEPGVTAGFCKILVLGEKAVAGMDGAGAAGFGGGDVIALIRR